MKIMNKLIPKAKTGNKEAMRQLIEQFNPLLKKQASFFKLLGLEYEDAYQQAVLYFISGVYQYRLIPPVTFAGYMKKRIKWGLWMYWRKLHGNNSGK